MAEQTEIKTIIDDWVDTPEGTVPTKIHILFDKNTREFAEQYTSALHISRNIPFNLSTIPMTDPLALLISNLFRLTDGAEAIQKARGYYEQWAYEATKHGWILALLEDNEFINKPEDYGVERKPRGIPTIPEPKQQLSNPVEYRLKQIFDLLSIDVALQMTVMNTINNAFAKLVQEVEETDNRTGFQSEPTGADVHDETSSNSNNDGDKPVKRSKAKAGSVNISPLG